MRVLVTGAQGCIGSWVVKQLVESGAEVIAYDLEPRPVRLSLIAGPELIARVRFETGSIEDGERLKALARGEAVDGIIHLAAVLMPFCQANPLAGARINVLGTLNVFEAARDAGRPVRVVYASSAAVWGPGECYEDRPLTEDDPLRPATFYGIYKQSNESCARVFHALNGITSFGLRPWTVYGVGRDQGLTSDPTYALKAAALRQPYTIRLSGSMDLQHVSDVAAAFIGCLRAPAEGAYVCNLAGEVVAMDRLIALIDAIRPGSAALLSSDGPQVPVAVRMDDSQLQSLAPGLPKTPLAEGLRSTIEAFEALAARGAL